MQFIRDLGLFFQGALDLKRKSTAIIEKEAKEEMDNLMLIFFADTLGLPLPISYYTLELLPYLEEEFEGWEARMMQKGSVWEARGAHFDVDP